MIEEKTRTAAETIEKKQDDAKEFAELLKGLSKEEKREVKGVMIGMHIMKDQEAQPA